MNAHQIAENQKEWTIGPLGEKLTRNSLPSGKSTQGVARRKADVVAAVDGGLLTSQQACERYGLRFEEFVFWRLSVQHSGMRGLRTTHTQRYRVVYEREQHY